MVWYSVDHEKGTMDAHDIVLYLGLALDLWRFMRIRWGHLKGENESASPRKDSENTVKMGKVRKIDCWQQRYYPTTIMWK